MYIGVQTVFDSNTNKLCKVGDKPPLDTSGFSMKPLWKPKLGALTSGKVSG